jgi:hypothetical protein
MTSIGTCRLELRVFSLLFLQVINTQVANVVAATLTHQHQVKITKANGAVVFVKLTFLWIIGQKVTPANIFQLVLRIYINVGWVCHAVVDLRVVFGRVI